MRINNLTDNTIRLFTDGRNIEKLAGGQNESYKIDNIVLKPIYNQKMYTWAAQELEKIQFEGIKISKPLKSKNGKYIENGYGATKYIPGVYHPHKIEEKFAASKLLHKHLENVKEPSSFYKWMCPWTKAQSIAWHKAKIPDNFHRNAIEILKFLFKQIKTIKLPKQLIHCDLAGNILFDGEIPVIIDLSPGFFPASYANTLLIIDSIAWHNELLPSIGNLDFDHTTRIQLIIRAIIFRICVPLCITSTNYDGFLNEYNKYKNILRYLGLNISH